MRRVPRHALRTAAAAALLVGAGAPGAAPPAPPPPPVSRPAGPGTVDWSGRVVQVLGVAAPYVKSATVVFAPEAPDEVARADAARKMLAAVTSLRTRGAGTVADLAHGDEELLSRLDALARKFEVGPVRRFSDGGIELAARLSLDAIAAEVGAPAPAPVAPGAPGLIVDASLVRDFVPSMLPSLATAEGVLLADGGATGGWRYAASAAAARTLLGAPKAPVVRASAVRPDNQTALMLPAAEAARLDLLPGAADALRAGRVAIVVGKPPAKK
jgi:hypothetical protein